MLAEEEDKTKRMKVLQSDSLGGKVGRCRLTLSNPP
jgi:hypothetical protein